MPVSGYSRCQCLDILGASVCQGILRYNTALGHLLALNAITNNTVYTMNMHAGISYFGPY